MPLLTRLDTRHLVPERMDDPALDPRLHAEALRAFRWINLFSGTVGSVWHCLVSKDDGSPVRVLDVACGAGDVSLGIASRARKSGRAVSVEGCDISPTAVGVARTRGNASGLDVAFFERDVIVDGIPVGYDVIVNTLFMHHLSEDGARDLLASMRDAAGMQVIVSDLCRSRPGLALAYLSGYLFTRSPIVRFDAPASVRAAFTPQEFRRIADRAGCSDGRIELRWPYRFLMDWRKEHAA